MLQVDLPGFVRELPVRYLLAALTFVAALAVGYLVSLLVQRLLEAFNVDDSVEGTAFERTAQGLGTSTVELLSQLVAFTIYVVGALVALNVLGLVVTQILWAQIVGFLPRLLIATFAVILGLIVGDKVSLIISERLKSLKIPQVEEILPALARYSVIYVALLIALGQLGVAVTALALKDLMAAGAAGIYLLLTQPYSIGDRVRIDDHEGIVQEVDVFTTRIESESEEFIVPNHLVMRATVVRIRE